MSVLDILLFGIYDCLIIGSIKENVVRGRAGYDSLKMLSLDEILIKYAKGELLNADSIVADNSADSVAISVGRNYMSYELLCNFFLLTREFYALCSR